MGLYSNRAMLAAVPKLHAAVSRLQARGDTVGAAKARRAMHIAMGLPKSAWFALQGDNGTSPMPAPPAMPAPAPPPAMPAPAPPPADPGVTLDAAHKALVDAYMTAKGRGDEATARRLEPYLQKHGIMPHGPVVERAAAAARAKRMRNPQLPKSAGY